MAAIGSAASPPSCTICSHDEFASSALKRVRKFLADESGATAIEYALIAVGLALLIIAVVNGLGTKLDALFGSTSASLR